MPTWTLAKWDLFVKRVVNFSFSEPLLKRKKKMVKNKMNMTIEKMFNSISNDGSSNNSVMMSHVGCR